MPRFFTMILPTNLTSPSQSSSSITLNWLAPENPNPNGLYHDWSADVEVLPGGADMPPTMVPSSEGAYDYVALWKDPTSWFTAKVAAGKSRFRGDNKALKTDIYYNTPTDFRNRQEIMPKTPSGNDKYRPTIKSKTAWSYSMWKENHGVPNFYQVMGQMHGDWFSS